MTGKMTGGHPFDDSRFGGASVLLVNRNFGCGSSREHAPQALIRWGIKVLVGESFAEIFFGNCVALGVPCVTVSSDDMEQLMALAEKQPDQELTIDLETERIVAPSFTAEARLPAGPRKAFLQGIWDATGALLEKPQEVELVTKRLPYMNGFKSALS